MSQPNINVEKLEVLLRRMLTFIEKDGRELQFANIYFGEAFPPQPKEEWRPVQNQGFWRITSQGRIQFDTWRDSIKQRNCLSFGAVFPTREAAEAHLSKYKEWLKTI